MNRIFKVMSILLASVMGTGCTAGGGDAASEAQQTEYTSTSAYGMITSVSSGAITIENSDTSETEIPISSSVPIIKDNITISSDELAVDDYVMITMTNGVPTVVDVIDQQEMEKNAGNDSQGQKSTDNPSQSQSSKNTASPAPDSSEQPEASTAPEAAQ